MGGVRCTGARGVLACLALCALACAGAADEVSGISWRDVPSPASSSRAKKNNGSDTWAVIVSTSRYWLNYRHATNALAVYQAVRNLGVPDSRIVLMLAEDFAHNPRNVREGQLFLDPRLRRDVHEGAVEVDYAGDEVSVESFVRVLTGRHPASVPRSRTLGSGPASDVFVYVTGHGGENFMKFQDREQMLGEDFAGAVSEMRALGRYARLSLVFDTCKAATLCRHLASPNLTCLASSLRGQNSYSKTASGHVGNSLVDEMTFFLHDYLTSGGERSLFGKDAGLAMYNHLLEKQEHSTPYFRAT